MPVPGTMIPAPGDHGGDAESVARYLGVDISHILDLSVTLNPFAPDLRNVIREAVDMGYISRYPDACRARCMLAAEIGVDPNLLVLTNGGAEAIALTAKLVGKGYADPPEFSLYERHLPVVDRGGVRFRSNPCNPTGLLAKADEQAGVWDEAFFQMATGSWSRGDHLSGAYVVGSLTKLFACPGLRIGYTIAPDERSAEELRKLQPLWSFGGIESYVVTAVIERSDIVHWAKLLASARDDLAALLASKGFDVRTADAPWVLVEADKGFRERLARVGVLVRDCSNFGMDGIYRVSVCSDSGLERLEMALHSLPAVQDGGR
ncbi:MAG: aminotransferase class I/II-fold pyridoxal phosphate-dependent enzyme [Actinobacteria bacterium]|nr:aminotransferase class I/II-fold pyridoxal phosphate-dependent enzyme [Actinomycetota bacterium]